MVVTEKPIIFPSHVFIGDLGGFAQSMHALVTGRKGLSNIHKTLNTAMDTSGHLTCTAKGPEAELEIWGQRMMIGFAEFRECVEMPGLKCSLLDSLFAAGEEEGYVTAKGVESLRHIVSCREGVEMEIHKIVKQVLDASKYQPTARIGKNQFRQILHLMKTAGDRDLALIVRTLEGSVSDVLGREAGALEIADCGEIAIRKQVSSSDDEDDEDSEDDENDEDDEDKQDEQEDEENTNDALIEAGSKDAIEVGALVSYQSATFNGLIPARVLEVDEDGNLRLDVKPGAFVPRSMVTLNLVANALQPVPSASHANARQLVPKKPPAMHALLANARASNAIRGVQQAMLGAAPLLGGLQDMLQPSRFVTLRCPGVAMEVRVGGRGSDRRAAPY